MNFEQIKGIVERVATVAVTYAVAKGWITQGIGADVVVAVVAVASVVWGFVVNKPDALAKAADAVK